MATYDPRNDTWRARWQIGGKRYSKSGFTSKKNAILYEAQQKKQHELGLLGYPKREIKDIEEIFQKFLVWSEKYKTPKSFTRDKSCINIWRTFFEKVSVNKVVQITNEILTDFVEWRSSRRSSRGGFTSQRTINLDLSTLRFVLRWAEEEMLIDKNPIQKVRLFKQNKTLNPHYLSKEEIEIIENHATGQLKPAIQILVRTGMRSGELCGLTKDCVDLDKGLINLPAHLTKAKTARWIPINETAKEVLSILIEEANNNKHDYLFCTRSGSQQTSENLLRRFRTLLKGLEKEGLIEHQEKINIHTLRRTYISHMIMAGEDPRRVMRIVGHEEWQTMKRYLGLHPDYNLTEKQLPY